MATGREFLCEEENQGKYEKENNSLIPTQYLDEPILFNILTRIPADILVNKFMYQCRHWRNLISNEYFMNTNFSKSKPGIVYIEEVGCRYLLQYMELSGSEIIQLRTLHDFKTEFTIKSSCNGLLLMKQSPSLYHIVNPVTKKHIAFQSIGTNNWCELVFHGEFKVVELFVEAYGSRCLRITTLNGKPPKHIQVSENYDDGTYRWSYVYINGVFYWTIDKHIVTFDLDTEAFHILQTPESCRYFLVGLKNLFGSLSLAEYSEYSDEYDVWSMEGGEWKKVFTLNADADFIGFLDDANLFIYDDQHCKLGAYNVKNKQQCPVDDSKFPMNDNNWCFPTKFMSTASFL